MAYICSKCDVLPGPLTQEMTGLAGSSCVCGGVLEEIDEDILKAFMPFAPTKEPLLAKGHRWAWMMDLVGGDNMKKLANLPPEQRIKVIQILRTQAVQNGTTVALYSGVDFSVAEGTELLK